MTHGVVASAALKLSIIVGQSSLAPAYVLRVKPELPPEKHPPGDRFLQSILV